MKNRSLFFLVCLLCTLLVNCGDDDATQTDLAITNIYVGATTINLSGTVSSGLPVDQSIVVAFSSPVDPTSAANEILLTNGTEPVDVSYQFFDNNKSVELDPDVPLRKNTQYTVSISNQLLGSSGQKFAGSQVDFKTVASSITITTLKIDGEEISGTNRITSVSMDADIELTFSAPVNVETADDAIQLSGNGSATFTIIPSGDHKTLTIDPSVQLHDLTRYTISVSSALQGEDSEIFAGFNKEFYTDVDSEPKFPIIPDEELLTKVQQQTFKYFYDFGHPASGMARERNTSGDIVTSGGSGFGIMALVVGMERGFITRAEGIARMEKIVSFLETSDRFHGAWSHWLNGSNGDVVPFSTKDDGGDLVETSFLVQGLITFRQYMNAGVVAEANLINRINVLWEGVEWDWYRKNNEEVLYWHWSPDFAWEMNFPLYGYFEEQITYVLAAASPTHTIPKSVYVNGFGKNGAIVKNNTYYGIKLPLESPAPLFWVQYSYLGLDPHFTDDFADYWEQNVNATRINQAYCIANPKNFVAYSDECWGLTASDNQSGYSAHSPSNDLGVITPTAALSSFPYTPDESMKALKFFYYNYGDRLWGEYGFYDAFNVTQGWTADSYLAIDQGPIIVMIENYRTGLLWDLFMSAPEVQNATEKLDFNY